MNSYERENNLINSISKTSWRFYLITGILIVIVFWGVFAYIHQLQTGLVVTGMRDYVFWGVYITNFVFFIGISHAGTLISAILRVTGAEWRKPITRMAEAITVFALMVGAPMVLIDLGRLDRIVNIFLYGRLQSPLMWDVVCIMTYLTGSLLYLYIPMIPDIAELRDRLPNLTGWKKKFYTIFSLNWKGTEKQKQKLEKSISIMAILIIPIAVSVHTVVSWIFGMTFRPGWHSTIFGPYFVIGAIFSGTAGIITAMAIFRSAYHLEGYIKPLHFQKLGILLLSLDFMYIYFTFSEYLTVGYTAEKPDAGLLDILFSGNYSLTFWSMAVLGLFLPAIIIAHPKTRNIKGIVIASLLVNVGLWLKRYVIIIPTLSSPFLPIQGVPWEWAHYSPTWVEWSITAGAFAGFALLYTLFSKVFPIVSVWENREEESPTVEKVKGKVIQTTFSRV